MCALLSSTRTSRNAIRMIIKDSKFHSVTYTRSQYGKDSIFSSTVGIYQRPPVAQERGLKCDSSSNSPVGTNPRSELEQRLCPLKFGSSIDPVVGQLPDKAKIVIVGGGAQGMAIAYKLALKGYGPDTVIIDQGQIGGGSTWNSAGIVSMLAKSSVEMRLSR